MKPISDHVSLTNKSPFIGGGRAGTVIADEQRLVRLFGKPQPVNSPDEKVTKRWVFQTPKGFASIRDYWWNSKDEWSVDGESKKAAQYLRRFFKTLWLEANNKVSSKA